MIFFMFLSFTTDNEFYMTLAVLMLLVYPLLLCTMFLIGISEVINKWWIRRAKYPRQSDYSKPEIIESLMCPSCEKKYTSFELFHKSSGIPICSDCEVKLISEHGDQSANST